MQGKASLMPTLRAALGEKRSGERS